VTVRQDTDIFPPHGQAMMEEQAWTVSDPEPPTEPQRAQGPQTGPQRRVRPRPHRRYSSPEEMWAWHWVRMRILMTWVLVFAVSCIVATAGVIIFMELT
jgi:hypothetical protein